MKATENFKRVIQKHLEERAAQHPLFAETMKKENKNIEDCITYILNIVKKTERNAFEDSDIYGLAVHYYDEDNLEIGKPVVGNVNVISPYQVEFTDEDRAEAKSKAMEALIEEERKKLTKKPVVKKEEKKEEEEQASLF